HEHCPARDRHGAGNAARDLVLWIQYLWNGTCARGVLRKLDADELGSRNFRLGSGATERARGRDLRVEHHVPAASPRLCLLPSRNPAIRVAARGLVAPPDIRI